MASSFPSFSITTLTILVLSLSAASVTAVPQQELESMFAVLRTRGYSLFANAVSASEVCDDVLEGNSFTFFAPTDSSLYALDMTTTASDYISTLRRHVVPHRLSIADLRFLSLSASTIRTLHPNEEVHVQRSSVFDVMSVDGVDLVVPGLFYGRVIAVHGLGGIIGSRSLLGQNHLPSSPPAVGSGSCNLPAYLYGNHESPLPVIAHRRFLWAETPEMADPPSVLSAESSSDLDLAPVKEPPPPSVLTDAHYWNAPSPSIVDNTYGFPGNHRDLMGQFPTLTETEIPRPFDLEALDCPADESETLLGHVIV